MRNVPFTVCGDLELGSRVTPYLVDSGQDVTISQGFVPDAISNPTDTGVAFAASPSQFLLTIPNGVRFLVSGGDTITYDRGTVSDREVALFLLGSAWGALCYQRELLPLHASAIIHRGAVHAFTGPSGAGKSTLSAALADRGRGFFTDDVLIIDPAEIGSSNNCYSGQKDLKLWKDALKLTNAEKGSAVRDAEDFQKFFAVPANASSKSVGELASLSILENNTANIATHPFAIEKISGAKSIRQLRNSIYRPRFANAIWGKQKLYQTLGNLIANVEVQSFNRTMVKSRFDEGLSCMNDWIDRWDETANAQSDGNDGDEG
jgi:hypothetical protein